MKYRKMLLLFALIGLTANVFATGVSLATNGVYLVVGAVRNGTSMTNEPIRFDDHLVWMTFCDTGKVELTWPGIEYGVKMRLIDPNGMEVAKTLRGKLVGSKYGQLHLITEAHPIPVLAWGSFKENPGLGGGKFLGKPGELFQIKKPGIYTLEIQMQMFRYIQSLDPEERSKPLFSFSPIQIKVEKLR